MTDTLIRLLCRSLIDADRRVSEDKRKAAMPRTRNSVSTASRMTSSNQANDIFSLGTQRDDLVYYVRNNLSYEERQLLMLHYAEELPFDEIAGIMKLPQDQIESIHEQIVTRLQQSLKPRRHNSRELCPAGAD